MKIESKSVPRNLYLDLMKKCLMNLIYPETERQELVKSQHFVKRKILDILVARQMYIVRHASFNLQRRLEGRDWSKIAHTMIGNSRLDNLQYCVEDVILKSIPGDFIETGVWRGGATIFMRAILKSFGITDRKVWVADSFEGLPAPNAKKYPADAGDKHHTKTELAVSLDQVKSNFEKYDLLDEQVCFLKGWFSDTLPSAPIDKLSVIRLDGDMYESTMDALIALYPKLSVGGYVIVDDYEAVRGCKKAIHDFRDAHEIKDEMIPIDWAAVYWQRS